MKTKLVLSAFVLIVVAILWWFTPGTQDGDRAFVRGLYLVLGAFLILLLVFAKTLDCPRCGADIGVFKPRITGLARPRRHRCRHCGCIVDEYGNPV